MSSYLMPEMQTDEELSQMARELDVHLERMTKADMTREELGAALQEAVLNNTKVASDITANLITSRLASYGFLAEAKADGVTTYRISAILDAATCPVCEALDGTEFEVDKAFSRVEAALSTDDPNDLKEIAPWPDQSEAGALSESDSQDLQDQGYDAPPFHPSCRCILVPSDEAAVDEEVPSFDFMDLLDLTAEDAAIDAEAELTPEEAAAKEIETNAVPGEVIDEAGKPVVVEAGGRMSVEEFEALSITERLIAIADGTAPEGWAELKL